MINKYYVVVINDHTNSIGYITQTEEASFLVIKDKFTIIFNKYLRDILGYTPDDTWELIQEVTMHDLATYEIYESYSTIGELQ